MSKRGGGNLEISCVLHFKCSVHFSRVGEAPFQKLIKNFDNVTSSMP